VTQNRTVTHSRCKPEEWGPQDKEQHQTIQCWQLHHPEVCGLSQQSHASDKTAPMTPVGSMDGSQSG